MLNFFTEVKNELLKVVWPTWGQTVRYTMAIIFLCLAVAAVLGLFDVVMLKFFDAVIKK